MNNNELSNIINMSSEIAIKLGRELISQGYYNDELIGHEYEFNDLKITYYNKEHDKRYLYVFIGENEVLFYNYQNKHEKINEGRWIDLIELIHSQIPNILHERKIEEENFKNRINDMRSLEGYFKYYIECSKTKPGVQERIDSSLANRQIKVSKKQGYNTIRNLCQGEDDYIPYDYYAVYSNGEEVAEFNGNSFNVFPNLESYAKKYKPGAWTDYFKIIIQRAKAEDGIITQKYIDNKTEDTMNEFIKIFKKEYKKKDMYNK